MIYFGMTLVARLSNFQLKHNFFLSEANLTLPSLYIDKLLQNRIQSIIQFIIKTGFIVYLSNFELLMSFQNKLVD
jgi:hypothetical protein